MIHRITYADGSYNEWYEPGRRHPMPCPRTETEFFRRVHATANAVAKKKFSWAPPLYNLEFSQKHHDATRASSIAADR